MGLGCWEVDSLRSDVLNIHIGWPGLIGPAAAAAAGWGVACGDGFEQSNKSGNDMYLDAKANMPGRMAHSHPTAASIGQ